MFIVAEIPYKAKLVLENSMISVRGPQELVDSVHNLKKKFGPDPQSWPLQISHENFGYLINEFILKVQGQFNLCYKHEELCHCRSVSTIKVLNVIKDGCTNLDDVMRTTLAGTGCGSCRQDIENIFEQFKNNKF